MSRVVSRLPDAESGGQTETGSHRPPPSTNCVRFLSTIVAFELVFDLVACDRSAGRADGATDHRTGGTPNGGTDGSSTDAPCRGPSGLARHVVIAVSPGVPAAIPRIRVA